MKTLHLAFLALCLIGAMAAQAAELRDQLKLAEKKGDLYAQIEITRRLLAQEPSDPALPGQLVNLWLAAQDYDMAERALQDWKEATPQARAIVTAKVLYYRDGKTAEAIQVLEDYHTKNPTDLVVTRQLADYLMAGKEAGKVVQLLAAAPGVNSDGALLAQRAVAKRNLQDFSGALSDFDLALAASPNNLSVTEKQAAFERLKSAWPKIQQATQVLNTNPSDLSALLQRAYWYADMGFAYDLALKDTTSALQLAPGSSAARLLNAYALVRLNKISAAKALEDFDVDTGKSFPSSLVFFRLVEADKKLLANPKDKTALLARAYELNDAPQQYRLASRDAEAVIALDPKSAAAHVEKVFVFVRLGEFPAAVAEYQALSELKPPALLRARALGYLAEGDFAASRFDSALDYQSQAIKAHPTAAMYKRRAATLQRLNREAEAQADLEKAKQLEKGSKR